MGPSQTPRPSHPAISRVGSYAFDERCRQKRGGATDCATGLVATLAAGRTVVSSDDELIVAVAIVNGSSAEVELDRTVATSPVLLFEVRDHAGKRVPTVPPPTPPAERAVLPLPPGGGHTFQHRMSVFSPPLGPGAYALRVRGPHVVSGILPFRVGR
jgi:hypothetical protein